MSLWPHNNPVAREDLTILDAAKLVEIFGNKPLGLIGVDPMRTFTVKPVMGRLGTELGHEVMEPLNRVARLKKLFVVRQLLKDWHPTWHISHTAIRVDIDQNVPYLFTLDEFKTWTRDDFAAKMHPEAIAAGITYEAVEIYLGKVFAQMLWPNRHAEQGSDDANFHEWLDMAFWDGVTLKGTDPRFDSYGGFADNGDFKVTDLQDVLQNKRVEILVIGGLCTEYCDLWTVLQAIARGYIVIVLVDAVRPVNIADEPLGFGEMVLAGAFFTTVDEVEQAALLMGKAA